MSETIKTPSPALKRLADDGDDESDTVRVPKRARSSAHERPSVDYHRGTEPYDALLWRLQARQPLESTAAITFGLTSCERRAGVTTVAANIARRAAEMQLGPVLLIDANPSSSWLAKKWRLSDGPGLAELVSGKASYADCLRTGPTPQLEVLTSGKANRGAQVFFEPGAVEALLAEACADHRLVIFDLPTADKLNSLLLVAKQLDQVLLVVRSEATHRRNAKRTCDRLLDDGVPLAGAVLNRTRSYVPRLLQRWV